MVHWNPLKDYLKVLQIIKANCLDQIRLLGYASLYTGMQNTYSVLEFDYILVQIMTNFD